MSPDRAGITAAARAAVALVIRTVTLRAALLVSTYAVGVAGSSAAGQVDADVGLATHQVAFTIWTFLAFALDAIAIAAQALTGRTLGSGDAASTRRLTQRMVRWGLGSGVVTGLCLAALAPYLGPLFTDDPAVHELLVPVLLVAAAGQPLAGVVFVLDGVLIGAGDGTYLAWAGTAVLAAYAPAALGAAYVTGSVVAVWVTMTVVFMGARAVVLLARARSDAWLVTGARR